MTDKKNKRNHHAYPPPRISYPFSHLVHDVVKRVATWHSFIGGIGLPDYWLYNEDPGFGTIVSVQVVLDSYGKLSKVIGSTASSAQCSIEFTFDSTNMISKVACKKGNTTELEITEDKLSTNQIRIKTEYPSNTSLNIEKRIKMPTSAGSTVYAVEIDINGGTLQGSVDIKSPELPKIAIDYASAVSSMQSSAKVAAQNAPMMGIVAFYFWQEGSSGVFSFWNVLDMIGTGLSDIDGPIITALYGGASQALCDRINAQ